MSKRQQGPPENRLIFFGHLYRAPLPPGSLSGPLTRSDLCQYLHCLAASSHSTVIRTLEVETLLCHWCSARDRCSAPAGGTTEGRTVILFWDLPSPALSSCPGSPGSLHGCTIILSRLWLQLTFVRARASVQDLRLKAMFHWAITVSVAVCKGSCYSYGTNSKIEVLKDASCAAPPLSEALQAIKDCQGRENRLSPEMRP